MDKIDEILRRVSAGELTPDQAKQALKPKRGRPQKHIGMYVLDQDGNKTALRKL